MNQFVNPYVVDAPLREGRGFFGRQDILDWVVHELPKSAPGILILLGQRAIGKTSLLLQLERILPDDLFLPIYFDLRGQAALPLGQVLAGLAGALAKRAGLQSPGSDLFDDQGHFFSRTFLPRFCAVALGENRRLVFLIDEFDVLDETAKAELPEVAAIKALFSFLRETSAGDARPVFVFAVGRWVEDIALDFAATFDTSLVREVVGLDWESAGELVRQAESDGTLQFSALAVPHVLGLTNGHPCLTQLLCQRIWERAYAEHPAELPLIDTLAVDDAVPDTLEAGGQTLAWLWDGLSSAEKIYTAALAEIADGGEAVFENNVIQAIVNHAAWLRTPQVELAPDDLVGRWVLEEAGERNHCFAVEMFRLWVRQNKPLSVVEDEVGWAAPTVEQLFQDGAFASQIQAPPFSLVEQPAQEFQVAAPARRDAASLDVLLEEHDGLETASVGAAQVVRFNVSQWLKRVWGAWGEARYAEALRQVLYVLVIPVLSVLVFYAIGMSLARGMSALAWMPPLFDASTFYRFGLVSAILGVFPGIRFSYECIKRPVFSLELVYVSLYRFAFPFLAVLLIYGVLVLSDWISQVSVSEDEWEGFRIFFSWLRRLWER